MATVGTLLTRGLGVWGSKEDYVRHGLRSLPTFARTLSTAIGLATSIVYKAQNPRNVTDVGTVRDVENLY